MEDKRLLRSEKAALIILICLEVLTDDCDEDLSRRIEDKAQWKADVKQVKEGLARLVDNALKTLNMDQMVNLKKISKDYELRLYPKLTPTSGNIVVDKETLRTLIDASQEKCVDCFKSEAESRSCKLQRLLSVLIPMESYDTNLCAFNNREWMD